MAGQVNASYSANFQKYVDFANKAYATKGEDTVVRFSGMPKGDYKGTFASLMRTADMRTANDQVRNLFLKTVADMFKFRNKVGLDAALESLKEGLRLRKFTVDELMASARVDRVEKVITAYVEGYFA